MIGFGLGMGLMMLNGNVAKAAEGLFPHAYGLRHKALAGAGVAAITDATGIALNPAGLVGIGNQASLGLTVFIPERGFEAVETIEADWGRFDSRDQAFLSPMLAYVRQLNSRSAIAVSLYANNGLSTSYAAGSGDLGQGPFRSGKAGLDLKQLFLSVAFSHRLDDRFSIGIAPVFAVQRFKAAGLSPYGGLSVDPDHVSNLGASHAYGAGVRFGMLWNITDSLSMGAAFQTKIWMSRFGRYRGLLADYGDLDMPANLQVGLAYRLADQLKLMVDYRHIFYSDIKALGNPGRDCWVAPPSSMLGGSKGCGFHWRDADILKLGLEFQATERLVLRAGYAYALSSPLRREAMFFNTLMPGIVRHQITAGISWRMNPHNTVDLAFLFAPKTTVRGPEVVPWAGTSYGGWIRNWARQFEISVGWTYVFGAMSEASQ